MSRVDALTAQPGSVLILAAGRDGELALKVLTQAGHACQLCAGPQDLVDRLGEDVSALLIAEELLSEPLHASLAAALAAQPAWSDLPILVVAQNSSQPVRRPRLVELGNVSVLTRPMAVDALSSSVAASIRARRRQLQVRDLLRDQQEQARRKDEFLAMLAHELRNPLTPIRYAARILQAPGLPADNLRSTAQLVERQVGHMATIIDDLLDVSRVTRGLIKLSSAPLDLAELVRRTVDAYAAAAKEQGVGVRAAITPQPVWVQGDATRLKQVLDNLFDNAVKFSPAGREVIVSLTKDAGQAIVAVSDHGAGLDPLLIPHIFEPFVQADRSLDRPNGGLGLGLALVRGLVQLHGGAASAESKGPNCGSTFTVRLPLIEPPALQAEAHVLATGGGGLRVLLAEDNRDAADSLKMLLEMSGHEVTIAYNGPDAVTTARSVCPEVVVCDIGLPGMNGYDVATALRQDPALQSVRLIAVTGYGDAQDRDTALATGFDEHLCKPVEPNALLAEIAKAAGATGHRGQ
jgi:signal transduction histidine kinase/ActR/RegA family two-component response regulator